jgi:hypothetical protein
MIRSPTISGLVWWQPCRLWLGDHIVTPGCEKSRCHIEKLALFVGPVSAFHSQGKEEVQQENDRRQQNQSHQENHVNALCKYLFSSFVLLSFDRPGDKNRVRAS